MGAGKNKNDIGIPHIFWSIVAVIVTILSAAVTATYVLTSEIGDIENLASSNTKTIEGRVSIVDKGFDGVNSRLDRIGNNQDKMFEVLLNHRERIIVSEEKIKILEKK